MRKVLCLYHNNCYDGFGAAWAVSKWAAKHSIDVEYRGVNYNEPIEDATGFTDVFMVDFAYGADVVESYYMSGVKQILIMDHHKSNALDPELMKLSVSKGEHPNVLETYGKWAIFDMNRSGAGLVWDILMNEVRPPLINYIEDRDIWRFALSNSSELNLAIMSYELTFENFDMLNSKLEDDKSFLGKLSLLNEGIALARHVKRQVIDLLTIKQEFSVAGFKVPAVNTTYHMSSDLGSVLCKGHPFSITYYEKGNNTVVSLRSTNEGEDVSLIAKQYGGGGHRNAAAFKMPLGWRGDK